MTQTPLPDSTGGNGGLSRLVMFISSPRGRILIFGVGCGLLSSIGACLAVPEFASGPATPQRFLLGLGSICGLVALLLMALLLVRTAQFLARGEHARRLIEDRAHAVDRLLDFSQTIHGAAKSEQVLASLCLALRKALPLSGISVIAHDPQAIPATLIKAGFPAELAGGAPQCGELEASLCPCMRTKQARVFRADDSHVRCTLDTVLSLSAASPAYCVPMQVGSNMQLAVHMLLPPTDSWTESARQLAQTYVQTAQSSLIALYLLADAEQRSMTDALTGLYNRRSMDNLLLREVALAERYQHPMSLVMIDLDEFKHVNDAHGHAAGDHMLRSFADCVRITLRKTDLAFRYGGDEFVIALPQTPISQAQQVVQKLRQAFASVDFSSAIAHLDQQPTLSIGVAERSVQHNLLSLESLVAAADQAMYEAKQSNRNCVRTYQPAA